MADSPLAARPLRVLMVCGSFPPMPCGVGDYTARLAEAFGRDPRDQPERFDHSFARRTTPRGGPQSFRRLAIIDCWTARSLPVALRAMWPRPDIVHIQYPSLGYKSLGLVAALASIARWCLRVPVVATLHEHIDPDFGSRGVLMLAAARSFVIVRPEFRKDIRPRWAWTLRDKEFRFISNASNIPRVQRTDELVNQVRRRWNVGDRRLIAYFGFIQPKRGIEQIFEIADPNRHVLAIIGGRLSAHGSYFDQLVASTQSTPWRDAVRFTGFLPATDVAQLLAAADAVVLPFIEGVGAWSTSLHAASLQGSFVLTTSTQQSGYHADTNVFYAAPNNIPQLRQALAEHEGQRHPGSESNSPSWPEIAGRHEALYRELARGGR